MNTMNTHVIVGAGPIGSGTAQRLADAGHTVKIVTRSGSGPVDARIELVRADASDGRRLTEIAAGAHAIYNCANPKYPDWAVDWPPLAASLLEAAEAVDARLVTMSNLYVYAADSSPMRATDPLEPASKKGAIRARMWLDALDAHRAGRVRVTEARASDFFGPGLGANGHFGDRVMPNIINGKSITYIGDPDVAHSWTFVDDTCDTLVTLGTDDRALGRAWHVPTLPAMSAQQLADAVGAAVGRDSVTVHSIPRALIRFAGLFSKTMRELDELRYQFVRPFELDSTDTTETFGLVATPLEAQVATAVRSYPAPR